MVFELDTRSDFDFTRRFPAFRLDLHVLSERSNEGVLLTSNTQIQRLDRRFRGSLIREFLLKRGQASL